MGYVEGTYILKNKTLRRPIRGRVEERLKSDDYMTTITIPVKFTEARFLFSSSQKSFEKILPSFWKKETKANQTKTKQPNNPKCVFNVFKLLMK